MSKRKKLRLLTSLIAAGCIFAGSVALTSAAEMVNATESNYIAIAAIGDNTPSHGQITKTFTDPANNKNYTYVLTSVSLKNPNGTTTTKQYWVREGYGLTATSSKYFSGAQNSFKLDAYANTSTPSNEHLVFSSQNGITDTTDTTVINNDTLHLITYKQYAAATNTTTNTPSTYNYYILRDGKWFDAGNDEFKDNFKTVTLNSSTGYYQLDDENVPFENIYYINDKIGVFLNPDGSVYKGPVYGANNEILVTAYDKESKTWSSVWGMQITDPNATIGSMTVSQFETILSDIHNEDVLLSQADVEKTVIDSSTNTIQLQNKKGNFIPGFTVESVATAGQDTQIKFTETTDTKNSFSINAGSRVEAGTITDGKLTSLTINDTSYNLGGGSSTDYRLVQNTGNTAYTVADGKVSLNVADADGNTLHQVEINGIASTSDVAKATTVVQEGKNISVTKDPTKNLYTIATKDDVSFNTVTVGSVKIDSTTGKITGLTAGTANTDAVNVGQLNQAINNNKISVSAGDNVTVSQNGNTYTVSAKDTTLDKATKSFAGGANTYTIYDTAGNSVSITDVASSSYVNSNFNTINNTLEEHRTQINTNTGNITTNTTNLTNLTKKVDKGWNYTLDGTGTQNVQLGGTQNFITGDNMQLAISANGLTIGTAQDVSFTTVTVGNVKVNSATGKITGLTAGTADSDAVNVAQLKEISAKAGKYTTVDTDSDNLEVASTTTGNETKYTVSMKNNLDLTANGSVTIGSTRLDGSGLTAGSVKVNSATGKITGLTAGTADSDAVNVSQLKEASTASKTEVIDGSNINVTESKATDGHSIYTVALNDDIAVNSVTANLFTDGQVSISNGQIIGEKYAITNDGGAIFANGAVSISGDGTLRAGNQNFTVYQDGTLSAKYNGENRINATEEGVSLSKGTSQAVVTDDGVSLAKGNSQVVVNDLGTTFANGANGLTNINGGIISAIGSSHAIIINGQTGTINGLSNKTFDANSYVSGQGATEDQLKQVYDELKTEAGKHTTVSAGDNISVSATTKDGQTDYQVSLKNDIALDKGTISTGNITIDGTNDTITAGDVTIDGANSTITAGDITIDGANGTINGLTNTTWSGTTDDAGRAATEGQLQDLQDKIDGDITNINNRIDTVAGESITGGTGNDDGTITINKSNQTTATITGLHDYALQEGTYKADTDGNVSLTVKDRYSNGVYSATIEDVASKKSLDSLTSAVGADSKETVKESYSNTYYIQDKDTLIDADVQLDKEIKQNRDQIIDNSQSIQNLNRSLSSLNNRVNKVGAGASALAALHPMDFDPDDKLNFSAGVGNYAGSTAAAIGAFYRPNERVMFSVGGTIGNGENMVNAGVSFALGKGGKISNTRVAVTHEILELRQQVAEMNAMFNRLAAATGHSLDEIQQFPDVPENHWAYEYVGKLAAAGIIEGYPDGNFSGDRTMTRYEFATMLFKAIDKGAIIDERMLDEFEPEIGRLHVERIKGEQNSRKKIERVRLNDKDADRDVYGGKITIE